MHCKGRMTKGQQAAGWNWTQASEMWCCSAKKSGLEKVPATMLSFSPKQACALQPSILGPGWGTACDMLATLLTALLAGSKQLFVAGCEPTSLSWLPRARQTLSVHITMSQWPRAVQATPSATSQGTGPWRAPTSSATGATCTTAAASKRARREGESKRNTSCVANTRPWFKPIYPGWESPLDLPQRGRANLLFIVYILEKNSNSARHCCPKQVYVPVFQLQQSTELYLLLAVTSSINTIQDLCLKHISNTFWRWRHFSKQ